MVSPGQTPRALPARPAGGKLARSPLRCPEEASTMPAVVLFCLSALPPVAPPRDEEWKKDRARLQGVGKLTAREARGRPLPNPTPDRYTLVIAGDGCAFNLYAGTLTLDPAKRPPTWNLFIQDGRYQGRILPGIYELSGTTLKLALPTSAQRADRRPDALRTAENSDFTVYTFE